MTASSSVVRSRRARATSRSLTLALLVLLAMLASPAGAQTTEARDTVHLANGQQVKGRVVRESEKEVVVRTGSVDRTIPRAQVAKVDSVAFRHKALMKTWQDTPADDAAKLLDLADLAQRFGLPHESRLLLWYAALARPTDAAIHRKLGNREVRGTFQVQLDGKWVPFAEADSVAADFASAWQLRSEHFTIRCSGSLRATLDALMELERHYHTMHELFGAELGLFELVEPVDVRLYGTRAQMPNLSNTASAYFSNSEPALFTCIEDGRPVALMHESTHALLHWFFVRAAKSRGELPSWLDEGWAEYMESRYQTRLPGKPVVLERSVDAAHQSLLANSEPDDRYDVHRLLNFKGSDFMASSRQHMKYAQSWALFRYLFEHQDPAIRKLFLDYLREAARGQGQASTFRRIFAKHEKQLETEPWR